MPINLQGCKKKSLLYKSFSMSHFYLADMAVYIRKCNLFFRVAMVGEKYLENEFFPDQGKVREFVDGQGNLERTWKVREFESMVMASSLQKIYLFWSRVQRMYILMRSSKPISLHIGGYSLKERICSLGEQILSFKSSHQIWSDTVNTIKE